MMIRINLFRRAFFVLLFIISGFFCVQAQNITWIYGDGTPIAVNEEPQKTVKAVLPRNFRDIQLGMGLEALKNALKNDGYFNFRGDRDVSFLPAREQNLVETSGSSFIRRAFFQLSEGRLFIMAFTMDTNKVDHYTMFSHFVKKYGEPSFLNPKEAVWENEDTRIAIERPFTVKYIDKRIFNDIIDESAVLESGWVQLKQDFINEF